MINESHIISLKTPKEEPHRMPPRILPPILPPKKRSPLLYVVPGILLLILLGWLVAHFNGSSATDATAKQSAADAAKKAQVQKEANDLVAEVGKLIQLPSNEVPTIATVSDTGKLAGQAFFQNAKVGDKVLIYTTARKAYLYRPSSHILIEVAPISTDTKQ